MRLRGGEGVEGGAVHKTHVVGSNGGLVSCVQRAVSLPRSKHASSASPAFGGGLLRKRRTQIGC